MQRIRPLSVEFYVYVWLSELERSRQLVYVRVTNYKLFTVDKKHTSTRLLLRVRAPNVTCTRTTSQTLPLYCEKLSGIRLCFEIIEYDVSREISRTARGGGVRGGDWRARVRIVFFLIYKIKPRRCPSFSARLYLRIRVRLLFCWISIV